MENKINKIKILFIIFSLSKGGAERVFTTIANHLDPEKFEITFLTIFYLKENTFGLNANIKLINLNKKRTIFSIFQITKLIYKLNPNIVFSSISQVNFVVSFSKAFLKFFTNNKSIFIMRETTIPSINNQFSVISTKLLNFLIKYTYPIFDLIIAQGENMKLDLINNFNINKTKIQVIKNPISINFDEIRNLKLSNNKIFTLITVGNLTNIKGHSRLIDVLKKLNEKIDFNYIMIGSGAEEDKLREKIRAFKLESKCQFLGSQENVYAYLKKADLFIQGSYYEGFPNVLIEANLVGVPTIAFDVPGGTSEIIKEGYNGFLIEDNNIDLYVEAILKARKTVFDKEDIQKNTIQIYELQKIINQYETLFDDLMREKIITIE